MISTYHTSIHGLEIAFAKSSILYILANCQRKQKPGVVRVPFLYAQSLRGGREVIVANGAIFCVQSFKRS